MQLLHTGVVGRVPPSAPLQTPVIKLFSISMLRALLVALQGTIAYPRSEFAGSGSVAGAEYFVGPITVAVGHTTEEARQDVILSDGVDGSDVSLHESSTKASWVGFSNDRKEPSRRRLDAAQELVRAMGATAAFVVAIASSHCCLHQARSHERCPAVALIRRISYVVQLRREECRPLSPWRTVLAEVGARPSRVLC